MLLVNSTHELCCWWEDLIDEDEDGLLRSELDSLPDNVYELADSEILADIRNISTMSEDP